MEFARFAVELFVELSLLYLAVTTLVVLLASGLTKDRLRAFLAGRGAVTGMFVAAALGAITPFCSCSTVPVVSGMVAAGVPVPFVTTFLVMSPLVNPATLALLATLAGPGYAALFLAASLAVALTVGTATFALPRTAAGAAIPLSGSAPPPNRPLRLRLRNAVSASYRDYLKLLPVFALAAVAGGLLHDYVAQEWLTTHLASEAWYMVPLAAVLGIPIYASTAVLLPLGATLYSGGVNLGIVATLLMGATGLSVPEAIMLKRLMGGRYLALVGVTFTVAVILIGYLLQAVLK